ncbi:hypothetical protein F5Y14DRAFT_232053 [Nemania sp. NC0429]|nr:hypothetical protein F5Y14DRAFT_232053 [Nemania sp. NC0429]
MDDKSTFSALWERIDGSPPTAKRHRGGKEAPISIRYREATSNHLDRYSRCERTSCCPSAPVFSICAAHNAISCSRTKETRSSFAAHSGAPKKKRKKKKHVAPDLSTYPDPENVPSLLSNRMNATMYPCVDAMELKIVRHISRVQVTETLECLCSISALTKQPEHVCFVMEEWALLSNFLIMSRKWTPDVRNRNTENTGLGKLTRCDVLWLLSLYFGLDEGLVWPGSCSGTLTANFHLMV